MGIDIASPSMFTIEAEFEKYGRELTQNERACAISHTTARNIIANTSRGGVIFEDDARILNLRILENMSEAFLSLYKNDYSALGLLDYSPDDRSSPELVQFPKIHKLLAEVPLAVATVLTRKAAWSLTESANLGSQIADWPSSRCSYYFLTPGCVKHGDEGTGSVIGDSSTRILGTLPSIFTRNGVSIRMKRLLQKLDTFQIFHFQSK
jgi:hypothetical protein